MPSPYSTLDIARSLEAARARRDRLPEVSAPVIFGGTGPRPMRDELDPMAELLGDVRPARHTSDISLDAPDAPAPPPAPPDEMARARAGWGDVDRNAVRAGVPDFLARGNAEREAGYAEDERRAQGALFGGPTADELLAGDVAFRGLQQARRMQDPGFRRQQEQADAVGAAETFMHPTVARARQAETANTVETQRALKQMAIALGLSPEATKLDERAFAQKRELAEINAAGRNPFGALLSGGSAPRGTAGGGGGETVSRAEVEAFAQQNGMTFEEAAAQVQREGFTIAQ